jgi:thiamine pyrophosphate-dependent acetolactate synthase large subunit-like protein
MLMTLGTLATVISSGAANLVLFVVQNDTYEITGNQPIPGAGRLDFPALARGAGFKRVYYFEDAEAYTRQLKDLLSGEGPVFVTVRVEKGTEGPISRSKKEQSRYLQVSIAESAHNLRKMLIS